MTSPEIFDEIKDKLEEIKDQVDDLVSEIDLSTIEVHMDFDDNEPTIVVDSDIGHSNDHRVPLADAIDNWDEESIDRLITWLEARK